MPEETAGIYSACLRRSRVSAKKARLVIDLIRGRRVARAQDILRYTPKRAAYYIYRVLQSAVANAENAGAPDADELVVWRAWIDEGPVRWGRWKYAAHGRVRPIRRRSSHIHVELKAAPQEQKEKPRARKSGGGAGRPGRAGR